MGLSFKELTSSVAGKLLTGAMALGAGSAMSHDAEAVEITTITQNAAALCIGSDLTGLISGQQLGWKGTLTDGKSTGFSTTEKIVIQDLMDNPLKGYWTSTHRNFAVTKWPANNGMTEGYYLYSIPDMITMKDSVVNESFIINSKNYPDYKEYTDVFFIKGATPDQDQMVFIYDKIRVYKSPFDATGKIKPEFKTGPILPDFSFQQSPKNFYSRAIGNSLFLLVTNGVDPTIQKLTIGKNAVTEEKIVILKGITAYDLETTDSGSVTMKDANGTPTTYLVVRGDALVLVNVDNISDYKVTDTNYEIAVEDPQGRYAFKLIKDGVGNFDTYVTDLWTIPNVNKKIITNNSWPLRGNLSYADGFPTPAWVLYGRHDDKGTNDKAYLIELLDATMMNVKVTEIPFTTFKNNYYKGGGACVTIPGQVATVVKTGTPADAGDASVVENANEGASEGVVEVVEAVEVVEVVEKDMDAGTTEGVDGGGTDVAAEVIITPEVDGGSDAMDSWLDGKGDMSDTSPDVAPDGEPDTMADQSSDTAEIAVAAEVDGEVLPPDMSTNETVSVDTQANDNAVPPVDTQNADAIDAWLAGDAETMKEIFADAGSSETSRKPPVIAPAPKDTGCNATGTGNGNNGLTPLAIALGVGAAVGLARRREAVRLDIGIDNV